MRRVDGKIVGASPREPLGIALLSRTPQAARLANQLRVEGFLDGDVVSLVPTAYLEALERLAGPALYDDELSNYLLKDEVAELERVAPEEANGLVERYIRRLNEEDSR